MHRCVRYYFGTGGYVYPDAGAYSAGVYALQLISNGRILIAGASSTTSYVARLKSNGAIDSTFGTAGYVYLNSMYIVSPLMAVLQDGSIVTNIVNQANQSVLVKMDSNGVADHSFGGNDSVVISGLDVLTCLKVDNDGNILAASSLIDSLGIGVMRILPNGQPDATFGNNGRVLYSYYSPIGGYQASYSPIPVVLPNGNIIVTFWNQYAGIVFAIRLSSNGSLDTTYGTSGLTSFLGASQDVDALLMSHDELLVAAKYFVNDYVQGEADMEVLTTSGAPDPVFPDNHDYALFYIDTGAAPGLTYPVSIKLLPDNKILLGGTTFQGLEATGFARFNYTGFLTTGINTVTAPTDIQLHPNPADKYAIINYPVEEMQGGNVKVFYMRGTWFIQAHFPDRQLRTACKLPAYKAALIL